MSRKSQRNQPKPDETSGAGSAPAKTGNRGALIGIVAVVVVAVVAAVLMLRGGQSGSPRAGDSGEAAALDSSHSPTEGDPAAKVHIVEFLDPACETCAQFYPLVRRILAENPNHVRLSIRHLAFHDGSEFAVRVLEASRKQDRYWQTLEALFASQHQWAPNHVAQPELVMQAVSGVGLDTQRLTADMNAPEVGERIAKDLAAAMALKVTATPEYFVNGRPLPSFGDAQLLALVNEELQRAY
jgi:protein-disulfide isomerase